jgi:nitrite reductase/ring-hydroxylating ferredoxin subunit
VAEQLVGTAKELGPGSVRGVGPWAVLNVDGRRYAVSRRCRHLRADLANGHIDDDGCLVCPWHQSAYDPRTGRMLVGPQGIFARVPGLGLFFRSLTRVLPLGRGRVIERDGKVFVTT